MPDVKPRTTKPQAATNGQPRPTTPHRSHASGRSEACAECGAPLEAPAALLRELRSPASGPAANPASRYLAVARTRRRQTTTTATPTRPPQGFGHAGRRGGLLRPAAAGGRDRRPRGPPQRHRYSGTSLNALRSQRATAATGFPDPNQSPPRHLLEAAVERLLARQGVHGQAPDLLPIESTNQAADSSKAEAERQGARAPADVGSSTTGDFTTTPNPGRAEGHDVLYFRRYKGRRPTLQREGAQAS